MPRAAPVTSATLSSVGVVSVIGARLRLFVRTAWRATTAHSAMGRLVQQASSFFGIGTRRVTEHAVVGHRSHTVLAQQGHEVCGRTAVAGRRRGHVHPLGRDGEHQAGLGSAGMEVPAPLGHPDLGRSALGSQHAHRLL